MSFQFVIDNSTELSVSKGPIVSTTLTRNGIAKSVSRGGSRWVFQATLPDGPSWESYRPFITQIEKLNRFTEQTVQFNNPGHSWFSRYLGDEPNPNITIEVTGINDVVNIVSGVTITSGFVFKAGDLIDIQDRVYAVVNDVAWNQNEITLHRPILGGTKLGNQLLKVGPN